MATKSDITTARTAEIIPSLELPRFSEAVVTLEQFEQELEPIAKEARELEIKNAADFCRAGELIAKTKTYKKAPADHMALYTAKVKLVSDFIRTRILNVTNKAEGIQNILTPKMSEWTRQEQEAAAAEQARLRKLQEDKLRREAEEKRRADEEAAAERNGHAVRRRSCGQDERDRCQREEPEP